MCLPRSPLSNDTFCLKSETIQCDKYAIIGEIRNQSYVSPVSKYNYIFTSITISFYYSNAVSLLNCPSPEYDIIGYWKGKPRARNVFVFYISSILK